MTRSRHCPGCGVLLPAATSGGSLCPQCLLKLGLARTTPADAAAPPPTAEATGARGERPDRIGVYRVLETLGEGGMGIVYLAEQAAPVKRRVALKLIKMGMDTRQVIARFEAERQALALMSHANVARVFDAGATEQGRPYFVMEYVPGIPITEYCDMKCLSLAERLGLFVQVCEAIQHAHQKGIIHRDIKPSNVLVGTEDGKPQLKVIDFGVAKATSQRLTERTLFTQQGMLIGTPEYMSPEQAGTTALDVDTRTDIYSLGVLLYELLVGALPLDPQTLRQAAAVEMLRIIREEDPPKPITKLSSLGDSVSEVARRRHTDARSLARQLRGELEWITMRALEKDPGRRYPSASELIADVERHLRGEPVASGPPGVGYRLRKLARKHRNSVIAGASILAMLVAGLITSTWLYIRAERARVLALEQAERNRLMAVALQANLGDNLPAYLEPARAALAMTRRLLGDDPRLATHLLNHVGSVSLFGFGSEIPPDVLEECREQADEAYRLVRTSLEQGRADMLETADLLAEYLVDPADSVPLADRSEELLRLALRLRERAPETSSAELSANRVNLARRLTQRARPLLIADNFAEAEPLYREAVALLRAAQADGQERWLAVTESHQGWCLAGLRRFEEAEPLLIGAYRSLGEQLLPASATRQMLLNRLVDLYDRWGRPRQAETYRRLLTEPSVAWFHELGPLPVRGHVGGAFSATVGERSLWVFRGNERTHDLYSATVAAAWGDDGNPLQVERGRVEHFLPLTPEEAEHNRAHMADSCVEDCGSHWDLEPAALVGDPQTGGAFIFYSKKFCPEPGYCGDEEHVGASIAVLADPHTTPSRPAVAPGARYPTLLFGAAEPAWGSGALISDGDLYSYACGGEQHACLLARVATSRALDRAAWRFHSGPGRWSTDWRDARPVVHGASALTVHWNEYLGKYLVIHNKPAESRLVLRLADRPEGPWSDPVAVIDEQPPRDWWNSFGLGHAHLAREGGRIETVSYFRPGNFFNGEVRLVEVAFR